LSQTRDRLRAIEEAYPSLDDALMLLFSQRDAYLLQKHQEALAAISSSSASAPLIDSNSNSNNNNDTAGHHAKSRASPSFSPSTVSSPLQGPLSESLLSALSDAKSAFETYRSITTPIFSLQHTRLSNLSPDGNSVASGSTSKKRLSGGGSGSGSVSRSQIEGGSGWESGKSRLGRRQSSVHLPQMLGTSLVRKSSEVARMLTGKQNVGSSQNSQSDISEASGGHEDTAIKPDSDSKEENFCCSSTSGDTNTSSLSALTIDVKTTPSRHAEGYTEFSPLPLGYSPLTSPGVASTITEYSEIHRR